jgi:hypothetical protein
VQQRRLFSLGLQADAGFVTFGLKIKKKVLVVLFREHM